MHLHDPLLRYRQEIIDLQFRIKRQEQAVAEHTQAGRHKAREGAENLLGVMHASLLNRMRSVVLIAETLKLQQAMLNFKNSSKNQDR
jgi:hypothetical protein